MPEIKLMTVNRGFCRKREQGVDGVTLLRKALLLVALSFLLYNIYVVVTATVFISHFPSIVTQLPHFIQSSHPTLQLGLFLTQEVSGLVGSYLQFISAVFSLNSALLFLRKNPNYLEKLRYALLFESLYFLAFSPAALNHLVGSAISTSPFLNFYNGVSFLLQVILIFPVLFVLSRKLKRPQDVRAILKWAGIAGLFYVLGFWVKNALMWMYAISPSQTSRWSFVATVGLVNSWLTLLVADVVCLAMCLVFRKKQKFDLRLAGAVVVLVGVYFVVYDLVSVWDPVYRAFLPLTDFWMVSLLLVGVIVMVDSAHSPKT